MFRYATFPQETILEHFGTSIEEGLTSQEAEQRLAKAGYNEISHQRVQWWEILLRQFKSAFIYLLLVAAVIVFALGEYLDAGIILGFVLINALLGFYQEFKSEQSLQALQQFIAPRVRVKRDGRWKTMDSRHLVPGDVISLQTGDAVTADVRILSAHHLVVNETTLTGESVAVPKSAHPLNREPQSIYESHNLCFSGTSVVEGDAVAVVLETGSRTAMGTIAKLTLETTKESEFSKGIARFSTFILRMILVTLVVVFVANVALKGDGANVIELLVFAIALVVSVIPEALPVVTTVSLSRGALELAKHDVVVKRLTAIEDIGSIEVLCSDKTGTLTENALTVSGLSPGAHPDLIYYATLTVAETEDKTEPFDIAIVKAAQERSVIQDQKPPRLAEIPFDPYRRRNAVLVGQGRERLMLVRGAPEEVMSLSTSLSAADRDTLSSWLSEKGRAGERTIALARRFLPTGQDTISAEDERELEFLGIIAFVDPIKASTYGAVREAKELGVAIKILTGDSPEVAGAVGVKIGLLDDPADVITGAHLMALPAEDHARAVEEHEVFARVTPEQKYHIIETLQRSHVVGFLGEGINDAPAIKLASVSLVVDSAADIARQAADVILLQSDLGVIVQGIRTGRQVFANGVKYLKATLAANFGNFYAIAIGSLFINFLPMRPLQILLVNLLSDFPMISIATDTVDASEWARPTRYDVRDIVLISVLLGVVSSVFDFLFFAVFVRQGETILQTNWFIGSILTELAFLFSIRTRLPFHRASRPSSLVLSLSAVAWIATIVLPYTAIGRTVFGFTQPTLAHIGIILGLVGTFFVCSELVKGVYYRQINAQA